MIRLFAALVLIVGIAIGYGVQWFQNELEAADPNGPARVFVVERGRTLRGVANELEAAGLVRNGRVLSLAARARGLEAELRTGEYELSPAAPALEVLETIISGRSKTYPVSIPEGLRATEIALRLEEAGLADAERFLEIVFDPEVPKTLSIDSPNLEGYLFPETYRFPRETDERAIVERLVAEFMKEWQAIAEAAGAAGLSMDEVVTLASIVEKETGAPEERPRIAGVFLNRLKKGMRLETDPTVIYGIEDFDGNLRRKHLRDPANRWNTYQIPALPPTPIASPGRAALRAVIEPEETDYLFFVARADGSGTHHFSKTYREHVNAVNRFQLKR